MVGFQADVSQIDDMKRVADEVVKTFGGVHYLHNNAGVALFEPMAEMTIDEFRWVMDVNFGVLYGVQLFRPIIEREPEGYISATSSMVGLFGAAGHAAYSSSKHAVIGLMSTLERELRAIGSDNSGIGTMSNGGRGGNPPCQQCAQGCDDRAGKGRVARCRHRRRRSFVTDGRRAVGGRSSAPLTH